MDRHSKNVIESGNIVLGIELGSTRIKTVLMDGKYSPLATGSYEWENKWENGIWTYDLDDVWKGIRSSYQDIARYVKENYKISIKKVKAIGISAMMHGYMIFDKENHLLVPFRTWRNTRTKKAAEKLTELFQYNIPQRWSIAHLYQAMLDQEKHIQDVAYMTTLSGYVHWCLTGKKVLGIGDASGMFPIDIQKKDFDPKMIEKFDGLVEENGYSWNLHEIMPKVLVAGQEAGRLTKEGARLLDPTGELEEGSVFCPPEGDAGTGMVATNSVVAYTGNISAGTSIFAMIVLKEELSKLYKEIDMVTTPAGDLVAMVHANNCTSDLNAWISLFHECLETMGMKIDMSTIFSILYNKALEGDGDCGGLMSCGFYSGENIIPIDSGRPLFVRNPDSKFTLANFMKTHLYASLATVRVGMDILIKEEGVQIDRILGHGGFFKTAGVGQKIMADAMKTPVFTMKTAGEGGAWGIALLAAYTADKEENETLEQYLDIKVFKNNEGNKIEPNIQDMENFEKFVEKFKKMLKIEQAAIACMQ